MKTMRELEWSYFLKKVNILDIDLNILRLMILKVVKMVQYYLILVLLKERMFIIYSLDCRTFFYEKEDF